MTTSPLAIPCAPKKFRRTPLEAFSAPADPPGDAPPPRRADLAPPARRPLVNTAAMAAYTRPRLSPGGLALVVAAHGVIVWGLAQRASISRPMPLSVLTVSLLPAPALPTPQAEAAPPQPRPIARRQPAPPVRDVAPIALPAAAPVAAPTVEVPVARPAEALPPPAAAAPAPQPAPLPAPTPPRFDTDYLDNPKPVYPALSRRLGEQGRVVLRVRVGANGRPLGVEVHSGSGSSRLDAAAIDTVARWQFVPARLGNDAIAAAVLVPIVFSLKE